MSLLLGVVGGILVGSGVARLFDAENRAALAAIAVGAIIWGFIAWLDQGRYTECLSAGLKWRDGDCVRGGK